MNRSFRPLGIFIFVFLLFFACPAFSVDQSRPTMSADQSDLTGYESVSPGVFNFYRNQASLLHSNMQRLLSMTGLDELWPKEMFITSEVQNFSNPQASPAQSLDFKNSESSLIIKSDMVTHFTKPTLYASMSEKLRSPILAPYKYKNSHNTLLSLIVPIAATDNLTIIPIVSYIFSMNSSDRNDFRNRISLTDKEETVWYAGINLSYSF